MRSESHKIYAEQPRKKHYAFAHIALRKICEQDPQYFFAVMSSDEQTDYIQHIVQQVTEKYPEDQAPLFVNEILVNITHVDNHPLLLFTMPRVSAFAECIYVGIVLLVDMYQTPRDEQASIRYFTLEIAESAPLDQQGGQQACGIFAEWQAAGHVNIGQVSSDSSRDEFSMLIAHHLSSSTISS